MRGFDPRTRQVGDVIVSVDGKPTPTIADLAAALEDAGIGKDVVLHVVSGGTERDVKVRVVDVGA